MVFPHLAHSLYDFEYLQFCRYKFITCLEWHGTKSDKSSMVFPHLAHSLYDIEYFQFCGNTIAGISLLSSAVMRLVHTDNKDLFADALIKRRSLYIMR